MRHVFELHANSKTCLMKADLQTRRTWHEFRVYATYAFLVNTIKYAMSFFQRNIPCYINIYRVIMKLLLCLLIENSEQYDLKFQQASAKQTQRFVIVHTLCLNWIVFLLYRSFSSSKETSIGGTVLVWSKLKKIIATEPQPHRTVLKCYAIFKNVVQSLEPGETPSNSASPNGSKLCTTFLNIAKHDEIMIEIQLTGTATEPQRNRKMCWFSND